MNTASLKKEYAERIVPALTKQFGYSTVMQVPVLEKIVIFSFSRGHATLHIFNVHQNFKVLFYSALANIPTSSVSSSLRSSILACRGSVGYAAVYSIRLFKRRKTRFTNFFTH